MKVKLFFNYILQFLVSILFFLLALVAIAKFTIFSPDYVLDLIEKNNYYDTLYDDIKSNMENYVVQSGFDDNIIDNIYTKDQLEDDVELMIDRIYKNESYEIDTSSVKAKLEENIDTFLTENNMNLTDKSSIQNFEDEIINVYKVKVDVLNKVTFVGKILNTANQYLLAILVILAAVVLLMVVVLKIVFHKNILPVMLLTSMFLLIASSIYFGNRLDYQYVNIYNSYVSTFISSLIKNFIVQLRTVGIVTGILGLIIVIVEKLFGKKGRKHES